MRLAWLGIPAVVISLWSPPPVCGQGKQSDAEILDQARRFLAAGQSAIAEPALRGLLARNPRVPEAYFLLGVVCSQQREHARAQRMFLEALRLRPDSVAVLNNLGVNALHLGQEGEAARYFRHVLSIEATDADARFNLGLLELKQRRFSEAAEHLRRAAAQRSGDLPVLQAWLAAELELGDREAVDETARRILRVAPPEIRFYLALASPIAERGFDDTAVRVLERARALWPQGSGSVRALLGDLYEKQNQYDKAVEEYQAAVRLNPENEDFHFALGCEFLTHLNFDLAEQVFSASIRRLPRAPRLRVGLSAVYFGRAQYGEAIRTLRDAIEIAPDFEPAYYLLGRAYMMLSDREGLFAGSWLRESVRAYLSLKPREAFPNLLAALLEVRENRRPEGLTLLQKALELDPALAEAWFELGKMHFGAGRHREAIVAFEKTVDIKPDFIEAYYRLGRSYQKAGQSENARLAWEAHSRRQKDLEASVNQRDKQIVRFVYTLK